MTQAAVQLMPVCEKASGGKTVKRQAFYYAVLSAVSLVGNLGLTALLHEMLGVSTWLSVPVAMTCMTLFNFFTLRVFIFDTHSSPWYLQLSGFVASIAGFRAMEYVAFLFLNCLLMIPYLPAYVGILLISAICKFLFMRQVLFAKRRASSEQMESTL